MTDSDIFYVAIKREQGQWWLYYRFGPGDFDFREECLGATTEVAPDDAVRKAAERVVAMRTALP